MPPPPKIRGKFCRAIFGFFVKFGKFSGKNHVKLGNFVNFSGKYNKNSVIAIIFGQESCKIRVFC